MKNYKIAVKWEVKIEGKKRSIQLFDEDGILLDGKGSKWDGSFSCSNNQLTSLAGAPESVGGYFDCYNNQLTSLAGAPEQNAEMFPVFLKHGYIFADGILTKLINKRKSGNVVVYKTRKLGTGKVVYVVQRDNIFSHGETVKQATHDLRYKLSDRDTSKYKGWTLNSVHTLDSLIQAYRSITGACMEGTRQFCEGKKLPAKASVKVAIRLTSGQYGSEKFKAFFVTRREN